jgi:hypothetical protein
LVEKLRWIPDGQRLAQTPLPDTTTPLMVSIAGEYTGVAQARAARATKSECPVPLFVLPAGTIPGMAGGKTVLAGISATRTGADAFANAATRCSSASRVLTITTPLQPPKE